MVKTSYHDTNFFIRTDIRKSIGAPKHATLVTEKYDNSKERPNVTVYIAVESTLIGINETLLPQKRRAKVSWSDNK